MSLVRTRIRFAVPRWLPRATVVASDEGVLMLEEARDTGEIIERVAALDIGKAELVCCVRVPDADKLGRRLQEVITYSTMTPSLQVMADGCWTWG